MGSDLCAGIDGCKMLIVNEYEFEMIRNKTGMSEAQVLDCAGTLIITRAARVQPFGRVASEIDIPTVKPLREADPTGVGDAYRAGIIKGMSLGLRGTSSDGWAVWRRRMCWNSPARRITRITWEEFLARYRENFGDWRWVVRW